jgi:hypothetical protein
VIGSQLPQKQQKQQKQQQMQLLWERVRAQISRTGEVTLLFQQCVRVRV